METKEFIKKRDILLKERKDLKEQIDIRYSKIVNEFIDSKIPYKLEQVILVGVGKRAKRMVIFKREIFTFDNNPIIQLHGWYLNAENKPTKWESNGIAVFGVGNPTTVTLSDNQTWHPVEQ